MKQTFKTLALVTLIGGSLTACNSNDTASGTASIMPIVDDTPVVAPIIPATNFKGNLKAAAIDSDATGEIEVTATVTEMDAFNKVAMWNGKRSIEAQVELKIGKTITGIDFDLDSEEVRNQKITLTASKVNPTDIKDNDYKYSYDEIIEIDGKEYRIFGELDVETGTLRPDIDVVNHEMANAFYITDEGTGEAAMLDEAELASNSTALKDYGTAVRARDTFNENVIAAHTDGWTGKGFKIMVDSESEETAKLIAPNADVQAYEVEVVDVPMDPMEPIEPVEKPELVRMGTDGQTMPKDLARVTKLESKDFVSIGTDRRMNENHLSNYYVSQKYNNAEEESALVAGGVALVWHKFDSLDGNQMVDLVEQTSDNKQFDLAKALSPVGNLR